MRIIIVACTLLVQRLSIWVALGLHTNITTRTWLLCHRTWRRTGTWRLVHRRVFDERLGNTICIIVWGAIVLILGVRIEVVRDGGWRIRSLILGLAGTLRRWMLLRCLSVGRG